MNELLASFDGGFGAIYAETGWPSSRREQLFRAMLWQAVYTVRCERQLMEQIEISLLFL